MEQIGEGNGRLAGGKALNSFISNIPSSILSTVGGGRPGSHNVEAYNENKICQIGYENGDVLDAIAC